LHHIKLIEIKALINQELTVPPMAKSSKPWQIRATELLSQQRLMQSEILSTSLEDLFTTTVGDTTLSNAS
jgi:hypothetical protein